jgi:hypothetical protein
MFETDYAKNFEDLYFHSAGIIPKKELPISPCGLSSHRNREE